MKYKEFCKLKANNPNVNMYPKPTEAQEGLNILQNAILGDDWYIVDPLPNKQANTEIVGSILREFEDLEDEIKMRGYIIIGLLILCIILFIY